MWHERSPSASAACTARHAADPEPPPRLRAARAASAAAHAARPPDGRPRGRHRTPRRGGSSRGTTVGYTQERPWARVTFGVR
eukprot:9019277-Pyramimonas_sp.AAC.1